MNAAKTSAQRVREVRQRRAALGLVRVEVWAHPDDHQALKDYAAKLQRARERAARKKEGIEPPA